MGRLDFLNGAEGGLGEGQQWQVHSGKMSHQGGGGSQEQPTAAG